MFKNIWRIINIKEGSCNIIYKINLSGMSILFPNKGMGRQRQPIGLSSIIYWAKKNQNCRQPKLDSSSGQIYWVISYHRYISRSRYAGEGENYRLKGTARCWRLAQQMLISWTKQQHHWFKKDKWKRKKRCKFSGLWESQSQRCSWWPNILLTVQKKTCFLIYFQTKL